MNKLCVNIDHIATVRQARRESVPDPVAAALLCEKAGAAGITAHLREDRRHMQDHDIARLRKATFSTIAKPFKAFEIKKTGVSTHGVDEAKN